MMHPVLRNILAVVVGLVLGNIVNGGLVSLGPHIIPTPEGADITSIEGMKRTMHLFEGKHYMMPFLAHALGTLAGAFLTAKLAISNHKRLAMIIGFFFLIGGTIMVIWLPAPLWFEILDLTIAYIPMAWLGIKLAGK